MASWINRRNVIRFGLLAGVSSMGVACVPTIRDAKPSVSVARVCSPKTDKTCHPTPGAHVVVK